MGDILCRNCGEPWDNYGARHGGDMTPKEYRMLIAGKGCPSCKGKPVVDCTLYAGIGHVSYDDHGKCHMGEGYLKWYLRCGYEGECEFKKPHPRVDDIEFLESVANNTDGMEALNAAMSIEFEERRK